MITTFEDLVVYQKARNLRVNVYTIVKKFPLEEKFALGSQMRRAVVSITSNIAEGFGRFHFQENIQFCRQARGSINEIIEQLNVCADESYLNKAEAEKLKEEAYELIKILNGYIASIKKSKASLMTK